MDFSGSGISGKPIYAVKNEYKAIGINIDKLQNNYIFKSGSVMLIVAFTSLLVTIVVGFIGSRVGAGVGRSLRKDVFRKVVSFSNVEFEKFSTASLITRSTNDIQQIQQLLAMLFRTVVYAPIIGIGGIIKVMNQSNSSMAWIIGLAIFCIIAIILTLFILAMPKFKKLQSLVDKLNLVSREILTGLPVIRAFHKEKTEENSDKTEKTKDKQIKIELSDNCKQYIIS